MINTILRSPLEDSAWFHAVKLCTGSQSEQRSQSRCSLAQQACPRFRRLNTADPGRAQNNRSDQKHGLPADQPVQLPIGFVSRTLNAVNRGAQTINGSGVFVQHLLRGGCNSCICGIQKNYTPLGLARRVNQVHLRLPSQKILGEVNLKLVVLLAIAALVGGCATRQYFHTEISDPEKADRQRAIDHAYCSKAAVGSVPIPEPQARRAEPESYRASGTINSYNPSTGYTNHSYSGTVTRRQSAGESFSQGYASGSELGSAIAAIKIQRDIYHGCMIAKGWSEDRETASLTARQNNDERLAKEKWAETIDQFIRTEASRPGGIDYRKDEFKLMQLDAIVKQIASDPKNNDKTMLWFLVEADRIVKEHYSPERALQPK